MKDWFRVSGSYRWKERSAESAPNWRDQPQVGSQDGYLIRTGTVYPQPGMVKVYAIALVIGVVGLLVVILGGSLAENLGHEGADPGRKIGKAGRTVIGGLVGFGMAGMSAEFSPLGLEWSSSFLLALVGAAAGAIWGFYRPGVAET